MSPSESFFANWYFHIPNFIMAALIYSLIARWLLELFFARRPNAVILNVFRNITDPLLRPVRYLTPLIIPNGVIIVFTMVWLMALRMFWFLTCVAAGMQLSTGG